MNSNSSGTNKNEFGFATTWIIGFAVLILMIGMVFFEVGRVYVEREKLISAADSAASAGATAIDEDVLIDDPGNVVLSTDDNNGAAARCAQSLEKSKQSGGQADTILDANQSGDNLSRCYLSDDGEFVIAEVRGTVKFGAIFSFLGIEKKELVVRSSARPSCSDNDSIEGGC